MSKIDLARVVQELEASLLHARDEPRDDEPCEEHHNVQEGVKYANDFRPTDYRIDEQLANAATIIDTEYASMMPLPGVIVGGDFIHMMDGLWKVFRNSEYALTKYGTPMIATATLDAHYQAIYSRIEPHFITFCKLDVPTRHGTFLAMKVRNLRDGTFHIIKRDYETADSKFMVGQGQTSAEIYARFADVSDTHTYIATSMIIDPDTAGELVCCKRDGTLCGPTDKIEATLRAARFTK